MAKLYCEILVSICDQIIFTPSEEKIVRYQAADGKVTFPPIYDAKRSNCLAQGIDVTEGDLFNLVIDFDLDCPPA